MSDSVSPFSLPNIRLFIAFRLFFNSRFYYPVFTILFLDYGLTMEQFSILNSVWAVTIVLAEVPSGALADILGRKKLLVCTSIFMLIEMALIAFIPLDNINLVFWAFLINRLVSGLAEAMASGADEAIAYDTLVGQGDVADWPRVLSLQMRISSIGSIITASLGAALYDANLVNTVFSFFSLDIGLNQQETIRFPVYGTLLLSFLAIYTSMKMIDPVQKTKSIRSINMVVDSFRMTMSSARWIITTPFAFTIILFAMAFDHTLRMILTMTSQFYRIIGIPEAFFGLIGAGIFLFGLTVPKIAEKMAEKLTPLQILSIITLITFAGLFGVNLFTPYYGIFSMALVITAIMLTSFFTSHYLNDITESDKRATILSFKGLALNMAYGLIGILFAMLIKYMRFQLQGESNVPEFVEELAFRQSVEWFPGYMLVVLVVISIVCAVHYRYCLRNQDNRTGN